MILSYTCTWELLLLIDIACYTYHITSHRVASHRIYSSALESISLNIFLTRLFWQLDLNLMWIHHLFCVIFSIRNLLSFSFLHSWIGLVWISTLCAVFCSSQKWIHLFCLFDCLLHDGTSSECPNVHFIIFEVFFPLPESRIGWRKSRNVYSFLIECLVTIVNISFRQGWEDYQLG